MRIHQATKLLFITNTSTTMLSSHSGATSNSRKRKLAPLLEPSFLQALLVSSHPPTVSSPPALEVTNGAIQALHDCQETFVVQLTRQLKDASSRNDGGADDADTDTKRTVHVLPRHVQEAMTAMGMEDILKEALASLHHQDKETEDDDETLGAVGKADGSLPKKRPPKKRKKKKPVTITAEMEAEQERLFQVSRDKILAS